MLLPQNGIKLYQGQLRRVGLNGNSYFSLKFFEVLNECVICACVVMSNTEGWKWFKITWLPL